MRHSFNNQGGFTVVELIIVIVVTGLLVGVLFGPLRSLYSANESSLNSIVQVGDLRSTLRTLEKEIATAISFRDTNPVNDPLGPNDNGSSQWSWEGSGSTSRVLIVDSYATSILPNLDDAGNRTLIPDGTDCVTPLINNIVYYEKNGTLYRRTIKNLTTPCAGYTMAQKMSCSPGVSHTACEAVDAAILHNVTNFTVDYFDNPREATPLNDSGTGHTTYTDPSTPGAAQTIVVTISATTGNTTTTSSLRITRFNGTTL